ncbi:MAG: UDP-2,4-diacetamido-2,4,6-trideoxy-beta-L-altropyranose hydrolase [Methanoregulaceae archaeon]|jgi:UDP-2,4-diacetamido-2,4,6-trideoxy-beta-L-altropyranose hydrolase
MPLEPLLIRADASPDIGTGHVMRCLALAEAWQDAGGKVFFVISCDSPAMEVRLRNEGIQILHINQKAGTLGDANETARIAHEVRADWIVVDGYQFGAEYQKTIKDAGLFLLYIDDFGHADHYYADFVLNQNNYADMSLYKKYEPNTRFLLGTKYVLIRKEFLQWAGWKRTIPGMARKILVTMGGSDRENMTGMVIRALKCVDLEGLEAIIVVGGLNCHYTELQEMVKDLPNLSLRKNVENMTELMAWADIAISAGGSTCWELAFMGLPSILCLIAENQKLIVEDLQSKGIVRVFGTHGLQNPVISASVIAEILGSFETRSKLSKKIKKLVDRKGAARIISAINSNKIRLRHVRESDCRIIWKWINDTYVRACSFYPDPIPLDTHRKWFSSILADSNIIYYIALDSQDNPLGQARFRINGGEAIISVLVDAEHRGLNIGPELIRRATEQFFNEMGIQKVSAYIKCENEVSKKAFTKAGYIEHGFITINGQKAYHLIK